MAYMCVRSLFVLTLLQLCRAEISDTLPESWYSANVINDGFQPKSISEIFSTESPFSSTNPIVVLPKQSSSVPDEILLLSTLAPPRKISTTGSSIGDFSKTSVAVLQPSTPLPPTIQTIPPSSLQTILPTTFQTTPSTIADFSSTQAPQIVTQFTEQTQPPSQPVFSIQPEQPQTTLTVPQPNFGLQSTLAQPQPPSSQSSQTQSQQIRFELVPRDQLIPGQNLPGQVPPQLQQSQSQSSTVGPLSNYFMIYQQAPQSIQGFPGQAVTSQEVPQFSTVAQVPTTREPSTVIIQPAPTVSPPSTRTAPPSSTTPFPTTVRVQTTPTARTNRPCQNFTNVAPTALPRLPGSLTIRVVAPSGSITNVNFNGPKTTTTRRPTTTRTRKTPRPKKNNYETCTDGCKGRREPICAAPLSTAFLNPDTLKGFPSVCHMACHNSYRKDPYEKVLDGRCGRLRTRIKTVDSNTKLKREELNKAQYFLDNSGTKTIVEFSALNK